MRSKRVFVRLSLPMQVALDVLAERQGLPASTVAFMRLREGLQRTIDRPDVQERVAQLKAGMTRNEWIDEQEIAALQLRLEGAFDGEIPGTQAEG